MKNRILRIVLFLTISSGLIWVLSSSKTLENQKETDFKKTTFQVLGDKVENIIPDSIKKEFEEIREKTFIKSNKVIEENEIITEVKKTIQQATDEINNFPDKQKNEIKKEVITQVCAELLKDTN